MEEKDLAQKDTVQSPAIDEGIGVVDQSAEGDEHSSLKAGDKSNIAKCLLIVEDEKAMAKAMALKLGKEGFSVDTAYDGEAALQMIAAKKYDLVLLDLIMPKVDGFEVLKSLKDNPNRPPIIISSNLGQDEDKSKATELGAVGFLVKSETPLAELVQIVRAATESNLKSPAQANATQ